MNMISEQYLKMAALNKHSSRKFAVLAMPLFLCVVVACADESHYQTNVLAQGDLSEIVQGDNQDEIIVEAKQIVDKYKLTTIKPACLYYDVLNAKYDGMQMIDVREIHGGECGGDARTAPRLFSIGVDEKNNTIWTDANSLTSELERLPE